MMPHSEFSSPPVSLEKLALLQNRHGDTEKAGGTSSSEAGELLLPDMLLPTRIRRGSVEQLGMPGTGEEVRPGEFARISRSSYFSSHTSLTSTASTPRSPRMRVRCQLLGPLLAVHLPLPPTTPAAPPSPPSAHHKSHHARFVADCEIPPLSLLPPGYAARFLTTRSMSRVSLGPPTSDTRVARAQVRQPLELRAAAWPATCVCRCLDQRRSVLGELMQLVGHSWLKAQVEQPSQSDPTLAAAELPPWQRRSYPFGSVRTAPLGSARALLVRHLGCAWRHWAARYSQG